MLGSSFPPHDDYEVFDCTSRTASKMLELGCVIVSGFAVSEAVAICFFWIYLPHFWYNVFAFPVIRSVLLVQTLIQSLLNAHFCQHIYQ